ncbi:MAG: hypothetical protein IJX39_09585 [Clostridia bacterium]|nr:hypothetical protein [Clostridia bacterium]
MTVQEAIELAGILRPNELSEEVLTSFLSELEGRLAVEVRGQSPAALCPPVAVTRTGLSIPAPFDRLYWAYLVAMIDLAAGDTEAYSISYALFREARDAYARWYQRTKGGCR